MLLLNLAPRKRCTVCKEYLPLDAFHNHRQHPDGKTSYCKWCKKVKAAAYYQANRTKVRAANDARARANPERKRAYDKAYYADNKERLHELHKEWVSKNGDRKRAGDKAWYEANKERHARRSKAYAQANADKIRAWKKQYERARAEHFRRLHKLAYHAKKDERRATRRAWYARNIARARLNKRKNQRARVARQRSAQTVVFTVDALVARMSVFGNRCAYCGGPFEHIDHLKPIALGGPHMLSNLRPSCKPCNTSKRALPSHAWLALCRDKRLTL